MKHRQSFPATIQIANPISFAIDADARALEYIRTEYVNRCYGGCFIVGIVGVTRRSMIVIDNMNTEAEGTMEVIFTADVVTFMAGEVLAAVTIKPAPIITGIFSTPGAGHAAVAISAPANAPYVAVNTQLPVRVMNVIHQPNSTLASIYAKLLTCDSEAPVYRLRGGLSLDPATKAECASRLSLIRAELGLRRELALSAPKWEKLLFFEGLLYAYAAPAGKDAAPAGKGAAEFDWPGPEPLKRDYAEPSLRNLPELVANYLQTSEAVSVSGEWSRPLSLYRSSPLVTVSPPNTHPGAVEGEAGLVFGLFLKNILDFLVATRELSELYSPATNLLVWDAMRQAQQRL